MRGRGLLSTRSTRTFSQAAPRPRLPGGDRRLRPLTPVGAGVPKWLGLHLTSLELFRVDFLFLSFLWKWRGHWSPKDDTAQNGEDRAGQTHTPPSHSPLRLRRWCPGRGAGRGGTGHRTAQTAMPRPSDSESHLFSHEALGLCRLPLRYDELLRRRDATFPTSSCQDRCSGCHIPDLPAPRATGPISAGRTWEPPRGREAWTRPTRAPKAPLQAGQEASTGQGT